jgi:hypothetical protein
MVVGALEFDMWCCVVLDLGKFVMMVGFGFGYDGWLFGPFYFILQQELSHYVYQITHGGRLILHWWWEIFFWGGE